MKHLIIIGKNSFIGTNLFKFLRTSYLVKKIDYNGFLKLSSEYLVRVDYIINCSTNVQYIQNKYLEKNDFDYHIAKKIKDYDCKLIFLSSRKVYKVGDNIKENSTLQPNCNYSENKIKTEKKLLKIIKNKVLIMRISNLIGLNSSNNKTKKVHTLFIDSFFENIKKNIIFDNKKNYKDFLPIGTFNIIIKALIVKNAVGIYNISAGRKIFLNTLVSWLNYYNKNNYTIKNVPKYFNNDCFYLNNDKLIKKIKLKIKLKDLEKQCKLISRTIFK